MIIRETSPTKAAWAIMLKLHDCPCACVVIAREDMGFEAVPTHTLRGKRILHSVSPCIAGVFTKDADVECLIESLAEARTGEWKKTRNPMSPKKRAWYRNYRRAYRERQRQLALAA